MQEKEEEREEEYNNITAMISVETYENATEEEKGKDYEKKGKMRKGSR